MSELDALRREHADHGIGPLLVDLLQRVVRATAPTYPPTAYSDAGVWNRQAIEDALQEWVTVRLIERADLAVMLASAGTMGSLRSMLTRSFRQFLVNRRHRTSVSNLYQRTVARLRSDNRFRTVGSSPSMGTQVWMLATHPSDAAAPADAVSALIKAAGSRSDQELGVVRYGPYSLKSSPILRQPALSEFLVFLLDEAGGCLSTADIFQVMRHRFNLVEAGPVEIDADLPDAGQSVAASVETSVLARSVVMRLDSTQLRLVREFESGGGDADIAATRAGVTPDEVHAAIDATMALVAEYAESVEDAVAVYRRLVESLFEEGEDR